MKEIIVGSDLTLLQQGIQENSGLLWIDRWNSVRPEHTRLSLSGGRVRTALLLFGCVLIGYWFNAFDDAVSTVGVLTYRMWIIVYFGGSLGCLIGLTLIAFFLFRVRFRSIPLGALGTFSVFWCIMFLHAQSSLASSDRWALRLYVCWGTTVVIGFLSWALGRERPGWKWLWGSLVIGLWAAILDGGNLLDHGNGTGGRWMWF